tara:strand:+ start:12 stop:155 length:144 start_codon:yes stop_codon:yes gene_type:complete
MKKNKKGRNKMTCDICRNLRRVPMTTKELGAIECCDCGEIYMVRTPK